MEARRAIITLGIAVALVALAPRRARAQGIGCPIGGASVSLPRVTVQPPGVGAFGLEITRQPVRALLVAGRPAVDVEVAGALRFYATTPTVPLALAHAVTAAQGTVTLAATTALEAVRPDPASGVELTAVIMNSVTVQHLAVPCEALMLDTARYTPAPRRANTPRGTTTWIARNRRVALRAVAGGPPVAHLAGRTETALALLELARRGAWVEVEQYFADGSLLHGWVRRDELAPYPMTFGLGHISTVSHCGGCGTVGRGGRGVYNGPAEIAEGTSVYATRDGQGAWATVATRAPLQVRHAAGDAWVEVTRVTGIASVGRCMQLENAWVPRAAVRFPASAGPR